MGSFFGAEGGELAFSLASSGTIESAPSKKILKEDGGGGEDTVGGINVLSLPVTGMGVAGVGGAGGNSGLGG